MARQFRAVILGYQFPAVALVPVTLDKLLLGLDYITHIGIN